MGVFLEKRYISTGVSFKANIDDAIEDAYSKALEGLKGRPCLILAFPSYAKYPNFNKVREALVKVSEGIPVVGVSTAGEYTEDGAHTKSLSLALFSDQVFKVGVGVAEGAQTHPIKAGIEAAKTALKNLGMIEYTVRVSERHKLPFLALLYAAPGREEDLIKGVRSVLGPSITIIGGSSGDDFQLKPPFGYQVTSTRAGVGLVVVILLFTKLDYVVLGGHACELTGRYGIVTKTSGSRSEVVEEINGKNAVEVYANWINKSIDDVKKNLLAVGLEYPLAVKDAIIDELYVKHPALVSNNGLLCFARIPINATIYLLKHNKDKSVNLGRELAVRAKERLGDTEGIVLVHCAGSSAYIGDKREDFVKLIVKESKSPLIGHAAYGEQWGYYDYGVWTNHNNLTTAMLVFGKKKLI